MNEKCDLTWRKAICNDLPAIVNLLVDDELGQTREKSGNQVDASYADAFIRINEDPNQHLMVVILQDQIIATCHLTIMPSLTYQGSTRMQIEAVRVAKQYRGLKIGEWMLQQALQLASDHKVKIVQLTTNKLRPKAIQFYERIGFTASHEGMKFFINKQDDK